MRNRTVAKPPPKRPNRIFEDKYTSGFLHRYRQNPHYFTHLEVLEVSCGPPLVARAKGLAGGQQVGTPPGAEAEGQNPAFTLLCSQADSDPLVDDFRGCRNPEIAGMLGMRE